MIALAKIRVSAGGGKRQWGKQDISNGITAPSPKMGVCGIESLQWDNGLRFVERKRQ